MSNYECIICNYKTKEKSNLNRHLKSPKHNKNVINDSKINNISTNEISSKLIQNVNTSLAPHEHLKDTSKTHKTKRILCEYCNLEFSRSGSLTRHKKICTDKSTNDDEMKKLKSQLEFYMEENKYFKQMLYEAGGIVKKSVSSLTYAMDNYNGAPALKAMEIDEIEYFDETEKKIVEDILSAYKHKTVGKYLGDLIIKIHKKDDPKNQSIWNTDDNRLTYLIKELVHNESSNWIIDKKGIKTNTYLIEPLLTHVKNLLISYQTNFTIPDKHNSVEMEFILENSKSVIELVNDIDDGVIGSSFL